jgi:carbon monoxide dehydrogenase subunit G
MVRVTRSFTVSKPAGTVLGYLKDFGNAVDWDPGTQSCRRQDSGPVGVGSTWHNVSLFLGRRAELIYRLDVAEPGHLVFTGTNDGATSTDDIRVTDSGPGSSKVTYQADIQLHGPARLAALAVKIALERIGDQTARQMQEVISAL